MCDVYKTTAGLRFLYDYTFRCRLIAAIKKEYKHCRPEQIERVIYSLWEKYSVDHNSPFKGQWTVGDLIYFSNEIKKYPYRCYILMRTLTRQAQARAEELYHPTLLHKQQVHVP